jgi:DNA replication and repair protein RecF
VGGGAVWVASLFLLNFRNYPRAEVIFAPGLNAVVGPNGVGKTNLLEAVDLAGTGRSHRALREQEVVRFGSEWAVVRARFESASRGYTSEVRVARAGLKQVRVDGVPARRAELLGRAVLVASGPEDSQVASGPAAERRRLLDGLLCQMSPAYYHALLRYHRVVRQRNRLLRAQAPAHLLEVWDEPLVDLGVRVAERRAEFVARMAPFAASWAERLGCGRVEVRYRPGWEPERDAARQALRRLRREEYRRGSSLVGPHRDDLEIELDGLGVRSFASRGQQRAVTLALRLAAVELVRLELGEEPILLLDDVLAELDRERAERLLRELEEGPQVLVTATDRGELSRARVVCVEEVRVG